MARLVSDTTDLIIDALAVARITRLVQHDRVPFGAWRLRTIHKAMAEQQRLNAVRLAEGIAEMPLPYIVEWLECPWCMSVWVAALVLVLRRLPGWRVLARVLAASYVAGFLAQYQEPH